MVGVPELFLERPCFSPISCSDGSLYIHTGRQKTQKITYDDQYRHGFNELPESDFRMFRIFRIFRASFIRSDNWMRIEK